jgi:hypothetical protein
VEEAAGIRREAESGYLKAGPHGCVGEGRPRARHRPNRPRGPRVPGVARNQGVSPASGDWSLMERSKVLSIGGSAPVRAAEDLFLVELLFVVLGLVTIVLCSPGATVSAGLAVLSSYS